MSLRSSTRVQALLLEPAGLRVRERLVGEVGQRRSLPERERLTDASGRGVRPAAIEIPLRARDQPLEPLQIELARLDPQPVALARASRSGSAPSAWRSP